MIRKHVLHFVLFYFSIFPGFSNLLHTEEEEPKKELGLQIGIDARAGLFLLSNVFGSDFVDGINFSNHFLFVKFKFLRLQFGTDASSLIREDVSFNRKQNSYRLKLGAEHTKALNPKFNFFVGGSLIYNMSYSEQTRNFNLLYGEDIINNSNTVHQFGAGFHCGVEWFVAKKLSLSTETNFNFLLLRDIKKEFSEIFPDDLGTKVTDKGYDTHYDIPFLNLLLRFKI